MGRATRAPLAPFLPYAERDTFLQKLHPVTLLLYLTASFIAVFLFDHPLFLLGFLGASLALVFAAGAQESYRAFLRAALFLAFFALGFNFLFSRAGETVLFSLGPLKVSFEAFLYGLAMGLRLLTLCTLFFLGAALVYPDKFFSLFLRAAFKSALVAALATRMLPASFRRVEGAREALEARGVDFYGGGFKERLKKYAWLLEVLLLSALEDAWQVAEAMQARAFGRGPRSFYRREPLRPRDGICLMVSFLFLGLSFCAKALGLAGYAYYPRAAPLFANFPFAFFAFFFLLFLTPLFLAWGWKKWPFLSSRI